MTTLTAVVFTGGESRRMGADKATLTLNGEPLWALQLRKLRELQPRMIAISARIKPDWCPPDVESILDSPPSRGPLSGIAAVLEKLRTTHLLALAVDLPRMTAAQLQTLWALARPGMAVIPRNGTFFEPLCAIYPVEAVAEVRNLLSVMDYSLQSLARILFEQGRAIIHPVAPEEVPLYCNFNVPGDLQ